VIPHVDGSSANGETKILSVHISLSAGKKVWKVVLGIISDLKLITANLYVHY
jgi:hypothetical protein